MEIKYEIPAIETANYGSFVSGSSLPGGDGNQDSNTGNL